MSIVDSLLDGLGFVGDLVDTPSAMVRTGIARRDMLAGLESAFDFEKRASGRDLLESLGILDPNEEGLDGGDVAGTAAEFIVDPTNIFGAFALRSAAKAAKAARASNAALDAAHATERTGTGLHNLGVDSAYRKLDDMIAANHPERAPDSIIDLAAIPPDVRQSWMKTHPDITDDQIRTILHGAPHEVGDTVLGLKGGVRTEPHPLAKSLADRAGLTAIGHKTLNLPEGEMKGFVLYDRPDVPFVASDMGLPQTTNATVHELLHTLARRQPETYASMLGGVGDSAISAVNKDRFGNNTLAALVEALTHGVGVNREEALANIVGNSAMRGASRQRFPVSDALNVPYSDVSPEFAALIKSRYPSVENPQAISRSMLEYIHGRNPRQNALVPVGAAEDIPLSFAPGPMMTEQEIAAIKAGYRPLPLAPEMLPISTINRLLGPLFGYNVAMANERLD